MQEFRVNQFITLKLENGETVIYIAGGKFIQCKYLLLKRNINEINDLVLLGSVDELELQLDKKMEMREREDLKIPPETEFWAHCSNMQVWAENNYNSKLLHRNLAFPLLKRLTGIGDPVAKRVFKEEIATRFESGYEPVVKYLIVQGYMECFNEGELDIIGENCDTLTELDLRSYEFEYLPAIITHLRSLQVLQLYNNKLQTLPISLSNLESLHTLLLGHNYFYKIPNSILNLPKLKVLHLYHNGLRELPENIDNMRSIQRLHIDQNQIREIPKAFMNLQSLLFLDLSENKILTFPNPLTKLSNLEDLRLSTNSLIELPESLSCLNSLKELRLDGNNLTCLPSSIGKIRSLQYLWLDDNNLTTLPESIYSLKFLKLISLQRNPFKDKLDIRKRFKKLGVEIKI
jgi:Leucine-rich repeat (LRR) protein